MKTESEVVICTFDCCNIWSLWVTSAVCGLCEDCELFPIISMELEVERLFEERRAVVDYWVENVFCSSILLHAYGRSLCLWKHDSIFVWSNFSSDWIDKSILTQSGWKLVKNILKWFISQSWGLSAMTTFFIAISFQNNFYFPFTLLNFGEQTCQMGCTSSRPS